MSNTANMIRTETMMATTIPPVSFANWHRQQLRLAQRKDALRWGLSFLAVLSATSGAIVWAIHLPSTAMAMPEPPPAAIAIDMAPEPVSTPAPPTDLPPGPQQMQSISDPAPVKPPQITAPPSPALNPPVPVPKTEKPRKLVKKHKTIPMLKKPISDKTPPAVAQTAPPPSEAPPAPAQTASPPGVSPSQTSKNRLTWQQALLAQLEKFKRYPSDAMAEHQEGVPTVTFSMDRTGHVLSVTLTSSSGHSLLDEEAVALPKRAQPLPIPPETVSGNRITLTVPVDFSMLKTQW